MRGRVSKKSKRLFSEMERSTQYSFSGNQKAGMEECEPIRIERASRHPRMN